MDSLSSTNTVSVMSAGNNGYWAENASPLGYLFLDGVNTIPAVPLAPSPIPWP